MKASHITFIAAMVLIAVGLAACAGLDVGDVVRVKTPIAVQQSDGLPSTMSLNEASGEYQLWYDRTVAAGTQWKGNIERGGEIAGMLNQLFLGVLEDFGPQLAGVPIVGPALPALTGLFGLFLGQWRLRKEKEKSYNAGIDKAAVAQPKSFILEDVTE